MSTLSDLAKESACKYLQSAVFIDDNIYSRSSGRPIDAVDGLPVSRKTAFTEPASTAKAPSSGPVVMEPPPEAKFHPKDLVGSFAKQGIVCALYEPTRGFQTGPESEVFKLCETADLVILDWDFFNDDGSEMKQLIVGLAKQSQNTVPHSIRLIIVYTTGKSLTKVANAIFERLKGEGLQADPLEEPPLRLVSDSTRIVVLGKDGVSRANPEEPYTVAEHDLADRVISEFAHMNTGILPSYALLGMAAVRHNSRRILDKFRAELDGAFLLHRALVQQSGEAFDQLPELLAEEFLAVADDWRFSAKDIEAYIAAAVATLEISPPDSPWTNSGKPVDGSAIVGQFLKSGIDSLEKHKACKQAKEIIDGVKQQTLLQLANMVEPKGSASKHRFAALFSTRTQYSQDQRILTFGTIVRHQIVAEGGKSSFVYLVCLMPACDSIRLPSTANFPFWRMNEGMGKKGRGVVVETPEGTFVELVAMGKIRDMLLMESFSTSPGTGIVSASQSRGSFYFQGTINSLEWVAQLKPLHAQRIAHDIGQAISRVGLAEAEWVRLLCDR